MPASPAHTKAVFPATPRENPATATLSPMGLCCPSLYPDASPPVGNSRWRRQGVLERTQALGSKAGVQILAAPHCGATVA